MPAVSLSSTLTKKILNLSLHTDGQEEQVKYHWPLESTQISTFSRRKLRYCATPNPQLLRCTAGFQWAKCSPVCPFENDNCCMAHLLSKQEDFTNQISMLEMVSSLYLLRHSLIYYILSLSTVLSIGDGLSIGIIKSTKTPSKMPKTLPRMLSMHVLSRWSDGSSTARGDGCRRTPWDSPERPHSGPYANKNVIAVPQRLPWCIWMLFSISLTLIICTSVTTLSKLGSCLAKCCNFRSQNIGRPKTSWEKLRRCVFWLISTIWTRIWKNLGPSCTPCRDIQFVAFGCPQLYKNH